MPRPWLRLLTAVVLAAPLAACAAPAKDHDHDHDHDHAKPAKKTAPAAKPAAKTANPSAKTAKPLAKSTKTPAKPKPTGPGMAPPGHRPPSPPQSTTTRRSWDVPQAKTLADTPDVVLNSRVRAALISALSSAGQDIFADTKKGVVTLTGTVPSAQQRAVATQVARKMRGVRAVKNQLKVKPAARVSQR